MSFLEGRMYKNSVLRILALCYLVEAGISYMIFFTGLKTKKNKNLNTNNYFKALLVAVIPIALISLIVGSSGIHDGILQILIAFLVLLCLFLRKIKNLWEEKDAGVPTRISKQLKLFFYIVICVLVFSCVYAFMINF